MAVPAAERKRAQRAREALAITEAIRAPMRATDKDLAAALHWCFLTKKDKSVAAPPYHKVTALVSELARRHGCNFI